MSTMDKGFAFSFDLLLAFVVLLAMMFLILLNLNSLTDENVQKFSNLELKKNAIFFMDALVKNSTTYDPEKHRTKSNELSSSSLEKLEMFENEEFFLKELSFELKGGAAEKILESGKEGSTCISIGRFVLLDGKKAKLIGVLCNE